MMFRRSGSGLANKLACLADRVDALERSVRELARDVTGFVSCKQCGVVFKSTTGHTG